MIVLIAIFCDFLTHSITGGWHSYFTIVVTLQLILRTQGLFLDNIVNLVAIFCGLIGLVAIDVTKYGRSGISLLMILTIFYIFHVARHYFFSAPLLLLSGTVLFLAFVDIFFVQSLLLQATMSWGMTARAFFGTLASLTLVFLGTRGNRVQSFLTNG